MRVGVNARTFSDAQPDGETQASMHVASTLATDPAVDVEYFGSTEMPERFRRAGRTTAYPVGSQVYGVVWERTVLPVLARRADLDVLLCPTANAPLTASDRYDVVTYVHDVNAQKGMAGRLQRWYRQATVPRTVSVSDRIVTVSEFSRREILAEFDVDPSAVSVVYNGIDEIFHRSSPGTPVDVPDRYVLYVGAMNPRKNVGGLLDAFAEFRRRAGEEYDLVVVGPENKFIYESFDVPDEEYVHTPGFLSRRELKYVYRQADLFCFPSLYEGFGLPPMEALACGTPVVASDVAALPELLGDAAELVDPTDPGAIAAGMVTVLTDDAYRSTLVDRGLDRAGEFTWDRAAANLKRILRDVVG